jgi:HlyD family secretion protein
MPKKRRNLVIGALALAGVLVLFLALRRRDHDVRYLTAAVDRGNIVEVVGATGTLQAVTTVQVGSQVSGTIQSLQADFNSVVKKGQVITRLDPSLFQARLAQMNANLASAQANTEKSRAEVADTRQKYERAQTLASQNLLPQSDLDSAKAAYDGAVAQVRASEAAVSQAEANVNQAQVDLDHTIITAPIDGVVINRSVDVGQTVAASFQAPVLFVIANDLAHMQVNASIDEADIGRVRAGQDVTFRVDSYPDQTFAGRVDQVRLQPTTAQNVVTYNTIITVDNPEQKLMPGMTATVSVIVRKVDDVLRMPAAALRFKPEGYERPARGAGSGGGRGGPNAGDSGGPGGGAGRPNAPRGAGGPGGPGGPSGPGAPGGPGGSGQGSRADRPDRDRPTGEGRSAVVFTLAAAGQPEPARVKLGISDGQYVEVKEGLDEGAPVITGTADTGGRAAGPRPSASPSSNPFSPQFQRRQR